MAEHEDRRGEISSQRPDAIESGQEYQRRQRELRRVEREGEQQNQHQPWSETHDEHMSRPANVTAGGGLGGEAGTGWQGGTGALDTIPGTDLSDFTGGADGPDKTASAGEEGAEQL